MDQALIDKSKELEAGLWLDLGSIRWGDGLRLERFARMIKEADAGRFMIPRLWRESGAKVLVVQRCDYAVGSLGRRRDRKHYRVRWRVWRPQPTPAGHVTGCTSWKSLLGLNLGAEAARQSRPPLAETAIASDHRAYLAGVRPSWDMSDLLRAALTQSQDGNEPIEQTPRWVAAVKRRIQAARPHMAGVMLWPLGEEDMRLWDVFLAQHLAHKLMPITAHTSVKEYTSAGRNGVHQEGDRFED